jgi:Capsule assembly protein Wzi
MSTSCAFTVIFMILMLFATQHATGYSGPQDNASQRNVANMASPYVPVDSWVYPAFELLAANGYVQSAFFDLRPWTRLDCARLIEEADDLTEDQPLSDEIVDTLRSLKQEFALELQRRAGDRNTELRVESIDQRITSIAGRPLTDGYHFAETIVDDNGRPFGQGANLYSGASVRATAGSFAVYISGEIQRVPGASAPNALAQQQIAIADFTTEAAAGPSSNFLRGRLLDTYASFAFANNQFTFGKQTLWWGPARSGSTLFSNNAEPITMLRYDRIRPFELPSFLKLLGPIRAQLLLGRLSGAQYVQAAHMVSGSPGVALNNQPWIHGEKFTFEPTPNFQFGVSLTVLFAGQGAPLTTRTFLRSIFSLGTGNEENDPGDRRSAVDASYRIPGLRKCLTGYFDGFTEDEPFALLYPRRSVWISGFAFRCVPQLPRLTIRMEGLLSPHRNEFPGYYYFNVHYLSGYTNNRQLIGSWIGREGQGEQLWATWQASPRSSFEVSGRSMNASSDFLGGGSLRDLRFVADLNLHRDWQLHLEDQVERWRFPLLSSQTQRDNEFTIQLSYRPIGGTK